jgi:hypothetical protein
MVLTASSRGGAMRRASVGVAAIAMAFLVACGGDGGWSDDERTEFVAGCTSSGAPEDMCVCMADKMEAAYPDELPDEAEITEKSTEFAQECVQAQGE